MKRKILYTILCFVIVITLTNVKIRTISAKEQIDFEWGNYIEDKRYAYDVEEIENGYIAYGRDYAITYDKTGKKLKKVTNEDLYCSYMKYSKETDTFLCAENKYEQEDGKYINALYVYLLNNNLEIKKENHTNGVRIYSNDIILLNTTADEYVLLSMEYGDTIIIKKDFTSIEYYEYEDMNATDIKKYWGEYEIIEYAYQKRETNKYYFNYTSNNEYRLLTFYDDDIEKFGIEIYDKQQNQILSQTFEEENPIIAELSDNGYFIVREKDIDDRYDCRNDSTENTCSSQLELTKYNFSKEPLYTEELQKLITDNYTYYYKEGRKVTNVKKVTTGILLLSNYIVIEKSLETEIEGYNPAIIKLSLSYDIETKTDGKGTIKTLASSKPGESVTFKIIPEAGSVLGEVKVTDANGNTVTFTSNTFTMPSSDVTIEAIFVPENPATKDIAIYMTLSLLLVLCFIISINYKKRKWLE